MDSNHLGGLQPTNSPKSVYLELAARLLFNIEAKTVLRKHLEFRRFITNHIPILLTTDRPSDAQVDRTEVLVRHRHSVPKTRMARLQLDLPHLQRGQVHGVNPKIRLDPDAPVTSQLSQMAHQMGIRNAAVGKQHELRS